MEAAGSGNGSVAGSLGNDGLTGIKEGVEPFSIDASAGVNEGVEEVLDTLWGVIREAESSSDDVLIMDVLLMLMTFTITDLLCFSRPMRVAC